MEPKTMEPEQVRKVLALVATAHPDCARSLEAHLAALTADRLALEALAREHGWYGENNEPLAAFISTALREDPEVIALRERVRALEENETHLKDTLHSEQEHIKRMQAQNKHNIAMLDESEAEVGALKTWQAEARAREAQLEGALQGARSARQESESRLSAIRQRAARWISDTSGPGTAARIAVRDVLGDDATGAAEEEASRTARCKECNGPIITRGGAWEHVKGGADVYRHAAIPPVAVGHPPASSEPSTDEACGLCPGCTDENWADADLCERPRSVTKTEDTSRTAEAFATLREAMNHGPLCAYVVSGGWCDCGSGPLLNALALLERRMGAMGRAGRMLLASDTLIGLAGAKDAMRDALTDAPAVFTLEEVERESTFALDDTTYLLERLKALRT
jgi:hypothetical protein